MNVGKKLRQLFTAFFRILLLYRDEDRYCNQFRISSVIFEQNFLFSKLTVERCGKMCTVLFANAKPFLAFLFVVDVWSKNFVYPCRKCWHKRCEWLLVVICQMENMQTNQFDYHSNEIMCKSCFSYKSIRRHHIYVWCVSKHIQWVAFHSITANRIMFA